MRRTIVVGLAMLLVLSSLAVAATPTAAHTRSDTRAYVGNCDAIVFLCIQDWPDPTREICASGTCWTGGVVWNASTLIALHDGDLGDGLDVRAEIDDARDPTLGFLCVAQETGPGDPHGNVCDEPETEPNTEVCGTASPWLTEALVPPIDDRTDWAAVFLAGPVTQALNEPPMPGVQQCPHDGAGATTGTVTIHVRE